MRAFCKSQPDSGFRIASIVLIALSLLSIHSFADDIYYTAEMDRIVSGCKTIALGGCGAAIPDAPFAALANPALPGLDNHWRLDLEGSKLYGLSNFGAAEATVPLTKDAAASLSYRAFFSGPMNTYDSLSQPYDQMREQYPVDGYKSTGTIRDNFHAVTVSAARNFRVHVPRPSGFALPLPVDLSGGLGGRLLIQDFNPNGRERLGMMVNLDAGLAIRIGFDWDITVERARRELTIAAMYQDFLPTSMTWLYSQYKEKSSMNQAYAISYIDDSQFLHGRYTVTIGVTKQERDVFGHTGVEAQFFDIVSFRGGYGDQHWTVGAGLKYKHIHTDYAITFDELAYTLIRFGLGGDI